MTGYRKVLLEHDSLFYRVATSALWALWRPERPPSQLLLTHWQAFFYSMVSHRGTKRRKKTDWSILSRIQWLGHWIHFDPSWTTSAVYNSWVISTYLGPNEIYQIKVKCVDSFLYLSSQTLLFILGLYTNWRGREKCLQREGANRKYLWKRRLSGMSGAAAREIWND